MQPLRNFAVLAGILLSASGCATPGLGTTDPSFCQVYEPYTLPASALQVMTAGEIRAWEDNLIAYEGLCLLSSS